MRIGIVGASGLVGETALRIIAQRGSAEEVRLFASGRSAGRTMQFGNNELEIEDASVAGFEGLDVVITSVDSAIAKNLVPKILEAVPSVVDNSSVFRMDPNVPLVLFGVNDDVIDGYNIFGDEVTGWAAVHAVTGRDLRETDGRDLGILAEVLRAMDERAALQLRLQQGGDGIPYQVYLMLPYALSILALVLVARRAAYPQALMRPYRKGER